MNKPQYFEVGDEVDLNALDSLIQESFRAVFDKSVKQTKRYLDTFDFRLCNEGIYLLCDRKSIILHNSHFDKPIAELPSGDSNDPHFWWELPSSALRDELEPRIDVRALMPIINIEKVSTPVRILNRDEKTVITLTIENIRPVGSEGGSVALFCIKPVRGYEKELNEFKLCLESIDLKESKGDYLRTLLLSAGKDPKDYSSKLKVGLTPGLSSYEALRTIMKSLLRTIKLNEEGIVKDIDIEFLHDFRVAVRRTRSALSQIKGVLPAEDTEHFKQRFSRLGKMTNLLRDLDIYLLDKERYRAMLPLELAPGLEHMFSIFAKKRKGAHRDIVKFLKSPEYKEIVTSWESYLDRSGEHSEIPNAEVPVKELANRIIKKKYKRILRDGSRIDDETPDAELHSLRIECKKLRYMIEFFSSLYPAVQIKSLVKHLKVLQDNLGEFNDLSVQRASMKSFIDTLDPKDDKQRECAVSSGGLISVLYERQNDVRSEFKERFKEFSGKETRSIFKSLFYDNESGAS